MFEKASRAKFRFPSPQGALTTEDLWDLPLTSNKAGVANLDDVAKALNKRLKATGEEESFVSETKQTDTTTPVMFEVVKHIIKVRLEEAEVQKKSRETRAKKQQILEIIARKQDEKLAGASLEELQSMVEAL